MPSRLWLGSAASYQDYAETRDTMKTESLSALSEFQKEARDAFSGEFGDYDHMVQRVDNVAVVSVSGPLTTEESPWDKFIGITSYPALRSAIVEAASADGVDGIMLAINSPGGAVEGISEMSDFLHHVDENVMPVSAYSGTSITSGAYWLGSAGRGLTVSELSNVGSIGVIAVHQEVSKALAREGITTNVLRVGKYKALVNPYEPLTEDAKEQAMAEMNAVYDVFTRTVAENRNLSQDYVKSHAAEGKVFLGREAVEIGLVDGLGTFETALSEFQESLSSGTARSGNQRLEVSSMGKKKVISQQDQAAIALGGTASAEEVAAEVSATEGDANVSDGSGIQGVDAAASDEVSAGDGSVEVNADAAATADAGSDSESSVPAGAAGDGVSNSAALLQVTERLASAYADLAEAKAQATSLSAQVETLTASLAAATPVVATAIQRLQVATGGAAQSLDGVEIGALVSQYEALNAAFLNRFPVGAQTEVPTEDSATDTQPAGSNAMHRAVSAATRISRS